MSAESEVHAAGPSPLEAFTGDFDRTKTGSLYQIALALVAFTMVMLPLIYIALIVLSGWGVWWHLENNLWIFDGDSGRGMVGRLLLYVGPAVAGVILIFFMIKPFFASQAKAPESITLDPKQEPLLFDFVKKICGLVGAPVPVRIDVDCEVNASASLRKGIWSKDLVLTIGLPLVSGLNMRQFAGVLAHEFGHFAQGAGMRLSYVIRHISFWFSRVVYERDSWDVRLEETARGIDWRLGVILHAARACVWLTRRILWFLMHIGNAISCFLLRQMEYDADSYEAKLSGSDTFASTASRLRVLGLATQVAYEDVQQSWSSRRLPENLPLLIDHKADTLPPHMLQHLADSGAAEKTGLLDTHPCDADRIRAVERLNQSGVFRLTDPSTDLFSDFSVLSKSVTKHQYAKHFELDFEDENLMSAEEIIRESADSAACDALIHLYYGGVNMSLRPLVTSAELPAVQDLDDATTQWRTARQEVASLQGEADSVSDTCEEHFRKQAQLVTAYNLAHAGFQLDAKDMGLPAEATSVAEQEAAAGKGLKETSEAIEGQLAQLDSYFMALRKQVSWALAIAQAREGGSESGKAHEVNDLLRTIAAVAAELPVARDIGSKLQSLMLLAQNQGNHSDPEQVETMGSELAANLLSSTDGIQTRLQDVPYPFPHAKGDLSMAEFLRSEEKSENEWQRAFVEGNAHVDKLFPLHYRLVGRLLTFCQAAESDWEESPGYGVVIEG